MEVTVELELRRRQGAGRDLGGQALGVREGEGQQLLGWEHPVDQPELFRLLGQHHPAGEQDVGRARHTHEARQQPRQAVLGRQAEAAVRGGQLDPLGCEPQVAVAGEHQPDAGRGPVDGGDDRLGDAELGGEVGIELRSDAIAGCGDVLGQSGVVRAAGHMTLERPGVGTGAEAAAGPRDHNDPDPGVRRSARQQREIFGVHPTGPGIEPVRPVQGDGGDAGHHLVAGDLEFGELHVSPT